MKIFVDDIREPPSPDWIICRNTNSAMELITLLWSQEAAVLFEEISLDHDLGGEDNTRYIVNFFCTHNFWPKKIYVHTANFTAREWIEGTIKRYAPENTLVAGY